MDRSWRLLATALSFAMFGVGALLVATVVLVPITFLVKDEGVRRRLGRACVASSFRVLVWFLGISRVFAFGIDRDGLRGLSREGAKLVVANHPTLIDVVVLLAYIDQGNCVVKEAVWRNPILSWPVRVAGYIPSSNGSQLLTECEAALSRGETVILFPEATRTVPGKPIRLQRSAANIALRTRSPIELIHIKCDPIVLSKLDAWYSVPACAPRFTVRVGRRLDASAHLNAGESFAVAARRLTSVLQNELTKEIPFNEGLGTGAQAAAR